MAHKVTTQDIEATLERAANLARDFLAGVGDRPVAPPISAEILRRALGGALPDEGEDARTVIETLARSADPASWPRPALATSGS